MNTSRPRSGSHNFDRTARIDIQRSKFDRSHTHKTTLDGGYLVPVFVDEAIPGDSWDLNVTQLCRMTTPIVPFMDNVRATWFFFSVPKRLVWSNFEDFITGSHNGKLGTTHTEYPTIGITRDAWLATPLYDYLGIPCPSVGHTLTVNSLPLRAYNLIWNSWFKDQNLQEDLPVALGDSSEPLTDYALRRRGKRHDYFTSALPWLVKGPDVMLPLGSTAPVVGNGMAVGFTDGVNNAGLVGSTTASLASSAAAFGTDVGTSHSGSIIGARSLGVTDDVSKSGLIADLSEATAATINNFREAFAIQHLLERDARGGSRYVESLLSHFGVQSPDFRLQRPEYLGGGNIEFMVNSVAQTSSTSDTPQGNLAAVAKSVGNVGFKSSFVEHCIVLGFVCITTDLTYQQGLNRMWTRKTRMDEYWPEFAHLGEQAVYEREIYATGDPENDDSVFGYQERFSEYRYKPSLITGKLRSSDPQSLDVWHLAQQFASAPTLSAEFIEERPPFERVLAVQDEPQFVLDAYFRFGAIRPLPMFSTPSLLDHF